MNNKQLIAFALAFLGIDAFAKEGEKFILTKDQRDKLSAAAFKENFLTDLEAALLDPEATAHPAAPGATPPANPDFAAQLTALQSQLKTAMEAQASMQNNVNTLTAERQANADLIAKLQNDLTALSGAPEGKIPAVPIPGQNSNSNAMLNDKFLCSVSVPHMAIDPSRPYNQRAYAAIVASRTNQMVLYPQAASTDYTQLSSDLGSYYRTRKSNTVTAFIAELASCEKLFPVKSGYQDQDVLVNMFMEEMSQAANTVGSDFANLVKGSFKFEPEIITMYGVMFVHRFTDLVAMEKEWIGDLNREGSQVIKWSFIEYLLGQAAIKLHNEREIRRIKGVRIEPTANVAGRSINGANGILKFIKNQLALFKMRACVMGEWTGSTISNYVKDFVATIPEQWRNTGKVVVYMSIDALSAYHQNNEQLYGGNVDYKADIMYVKQYPNVTIEAVPNMGSSKRIFASLKGNINNFEHVAGEMYNFSIEQQDWTLKVWSIWKESIWAYVVGKKFASLAAMPDDFSTQLIWCNDVDEPASYFIDAAADDTTPSVLNHTSIRTIANTVATAITTFDDCAVGQQVTVKCGNTTNASTIAKSGNFSLISAAWTPDLGDTITLKKRSDGKFIEISRNMATTGAIAFTADDTTPSVADGTVFVTVANTVATAITNFDDMVEGIVYRIYGGSDTNSATMANSGNFVLTAAMTLSNGAWIDLQKVASGKISEIQRSA